jgi:hypothetical protein
MGPGVFLAQHVALINSLAFDVGETAFGAGYANGRDGEKMSAGQQVVNHGGCVNGTHHTHGLQPSVFETGGDQDNTAAPVPVGAGPPGMIGGGSDSDSPSPQPVKVKIKNETTKKAARFLGFALTIQWPVWSMKVVRLCPYWTYVTHTHPRARHCAAILVKKSRYGG